MQMKQKNMKSGAAILFLIFGLLFFILIFRFVYIEATGKAGGQVLAARIEKKYKKVHPIEAERGKILDSKGEVIAEDTSSFTLKAVLDKSVTLNKNKPNNVVDPEGTAEKLSKYIKMDKEAIYERLTKKGAFEVELGPSGKDLSNDVKQKIEKLALPGIYFTRDNKRFYPNGVFASHLIGFTEKDPDTGKTSGRLGIEKYLNDYLKEKNGKITYNSDRWGVLLPNSKQHVTPPKNGKNVTLTIDKKIQTFLEDSLTKVQKKYNPKDIIAIVSNPKTGEIVAMSQRPTFHPQTREGLADTWHNLSIEEAFEPGSTMKIFTLAAAVQENVFDPNGTYTSGSYKVPGSIPIKDHSGIPKGKTMTFLEAVQRSSNVGFATLGMDKLGPDRLRDYLTKFGLDKKTGIDLPYEANSKIQYKWKRDKASTAFGQASAITPIQQIQAVSAVANNGKMMKPYVIKSISSPDTKKVIKKTKPSVAGEPISAETAKKVREYLGTVITAKHGTGQKYKIDGYEVAGKTGTAQMSGPGGAYLHGKNNYVFSFMGMAPKKDPQLVMYVAVKQPQLAGNEAGSDPLSEIFDPVMQNSLQYLNIKPSNLKDETAEKIGDYRDQTTSSAKADLTNKGYDAVVVGKGKMVIDQSPKPGSILLEGEKVVLRTDGSMTAPDMTGWSLRDVMKVASIAGLDLNASGTGYVSSQNLKAGKVIKEGTYCIVNLKKPSDISLMKTEKKKDEVHD
ncbi:penicillin-binding protein 2B [Bacillus sp. OV322]|nr:penicillin-binding protein 2B [Bacillus sp. OV322]